MTKFTLLMAASLLALAPQMAYASGTEQDMPGLTSIPAKASAVAQEDDLDAQIAAEESRQKQLAEEEKRQRLAALKAENDKKEKTLGQKIGSEVDKGLQKTGAQVQRFGKHLKKGKF